MALSSRICTSLASLVLLFVSTTTYAFRIAVVGHNGRIGSRILQAISEQKNKSVEVCGIDRASLEERLAGVGYGKDFSEFNAVICCLGSGHLASEMSFHVDGLLVQSLCTKARRNGVEHFVLLSSVGVDDFYSEWSLEELKRRNVKECISDAPGNKRPEVLHWKRETEFHLRSLAEMSHLIVRVPHDVLDDDACKEAEAVEPHPPGSFSALPTSTVWASLESVARYVSDEIGPTKSCTSRTVEIAVPTLKSKGYLEHIPNSKLVSTI